MKFGTRYQDDNRSSGGSSGFVEFIKYFKEAETRVRFLEEIDDWTKYWQHFNATKRRGYPCTRDMDTCPGCTSEDDREAKASCRYLVNTLNQDTGYVSLFAIPVSLIDDCNRASDKDSGTIMARDYTVIRRGQQLSVEYRLEAEAKDNMSLTKYSKNFQDHEKALADAFIEVWGALPDGTIKIPALGEENQDRPLRVERPRKKPGAAFKNDEVAENGQEPHLTPVPSEPKETKEEDIELSEGQLRSMSPEAIKDLFKRCGLEAPETDDPNELADRLMAEVGAAVG